MATQKTDTLSHDNEEITEDKYRIYAAMSFMIVVVLIGLPMWWKSTEVYRVDLPSDNIGKLRHIPVRIAVTIDIFMLTTQRGELLKKELDSIYADNDVWNIEFQLVPKIPNAEARHTPAALECEILKRRRQAIGNFLFMEWPRLQEEVLLTTERTAYIRSDTSASKISSVLNVVLLQAHRIKDILSQDEQRPSIKSEAPQPNYDVIITVLNPRPDIMKVDWNVQMAVETYIAAFLKDVSDISNYTVKTQWKFQLSIEADLKQVRDTSLLGRHYALPESALPHIITSIEKNLVAGTSDKNVLNMVIYVAPCEIAPLHIYNNAGEPAHRNNVDSFIAPRWGGVIIANPSESVCLSYLNNQQPVQVNLHTNDIMQIMLYQLQNLLDISVEFNILGVKSVESEQIAPYKWAYEAYLRRSAVMHVVTATNTLQSLLKLLANISYIVINDEVGAAINEAREEIVIAKMALAFGDVMTASDSAKRAFIASEHAFFDASLLAQLYFPDEQKYAIYIPLFLPIMVPVLTSFSSLRKLLKKVRNANKHKQA